MIPILQQGGKQVMLNALFFQPTRWCGLNCKGCYVKAHEGGENGDHINWSEWRHLFQLFYTGPHWANQITIAVDDLHNEPGKERHMLLTIGGILESIITTKIVANRRIDLPEVHMTMHTPDTYLQYRNTGTIGFDKLSMVSFSVLPLHSAKTIQVVEQFKAWNIPINFNYLVPTKFDAAKEIEMLTIQARHNVDTIYLVMLKSPVGAEDTFAVEKGREIWGLYQLYISEVVDKLPSDVRCKVSIDGCMSDTVKHSRTGFGCASNVSRVQVWPDGSVSGCPYAFSGNTSGARFAEDIVENIREAKKRYDFRERCHLPRVYSPFSGRQGLRVFQIS